MRKRHGQRCRSCDGVGIQPCNVHIWWMGNGFQSQLHYVDVCIGQSCHLSLMFPKLCWWTMCRFAIGWWFLIYQLLDPSNKVSIVFHCFHGFHPDHEHLILPTWDGGTPTNRLLQPFWKVFLENPRFSRKTRGFHQASGKTRGSSLYPTNSQDWGSLGRGSEHFWRFRCRKSACRCGAKHISKSKR